MTEKTPHTPPRRSYLGWAFAQLALFVYWLAQILLVGIIDAIVRRKFSFKGFGLGLATMLVGITGVSATLFVRAPLPEEVNDVALWGGVLLVMALAGAVVARTSHRVGFWEIELATLIATLLFVVHLAWGWDRALGIGPGERETYFELIVAGPPGARLLGPMWARLVGLAAAGGFLVALVGASLAFLVYGDEGRRDRGVIVERFIGLRHLTSHRRGGMSVTAVVAVLGVMLGVAALIVVNAVMSGYQEDIRDKILTTNAHLVIQKYGQDFTDYRKVEAEVQALPEVVAASPYTFNEVLVSAGDVAMGVLIKGVDPKRASEVTDITSHLCAGLDPEGNCERFAGVDAKSVLASLLEPKGGIPGVIVGTELYRKLDVPMGSPITLTTPVGIAGARGNAPRRSEFRIVGLYRSGMYDFDARLVYVELSASQKLMGLGQAVNGVELRVADPERVEDAARAVLRAVGRYPFHAIDWRELNRGIFTALKLQKIAMFLVLTFIVIVAAFNIASTLFMAVVEKAHEIGVLKSMGARDSSIMKIFVFEGWLVGGLGTLLGVALGLAAAWLVSELHIGIAADVYMVGSLSVRIRALDVGLVAASALGISHLATIYPALKAARQAPVEAMRYE